MPTTERRAFIATACQGDDDLRQKVEALLRGLDQDDGFFDSPAVGLMRGSDAHAETVGSHIGCYRLRQEIGSGGMGVVYFAEQSEPVQRQVAIKIIKPGMDSREVIARFEIERQALAMMDHPNIAKVFDAGTTESGHPYFVMELVQGAPITAYCEKKQMSLDGCLELLVKVSSAVQHAHQKGVIHRDLKPTNILVSECDGIPIPKIIDFGVAKALNRRLTEKSVFTELGRLIGTLDYMSPEQASLNHLNVDTRSDIYSLGVLMYEMLTGVTPLGREKAESSPFDEQLRIVREIEPQKPSTLSHARFATRFQRRIQTRSSHWKHELDWITMRALEKDPSRRYDTAIGFADDVQRFLHNEPVAACPPSLTYQLRKLAVRHMKLITGTAICVCLLIVGIIGTSIGFVRAATAVKKLEERESLLLEQNKVQQESLRQLEWTPLSEETQVLLAENNLALDRKFLNERANDPYWRFRTAQSQRQLAEIQLRFRHFAEAENGFTVAIAILDKLVHDFSQNTDYQRELADCFYGRARCEIRLTSHEKDTFDFGERDFTRAINIYSRLCDADPDNHHLAQQMAEFHSWYGLRLGLASRFRDAEKQFTSALSIWNTSLAPANAAPEYSTAAAQTHTHYGRIMLQRYQLEEAEIHLNDAEALLRRVLNNHPNYTAKPVVHRSLAALNSHRGKIFNLHGRWPSAVAEFQTAIDVLEKYVADIYGDYVVQVTGFRHREIANAYLGLGDLSRARSELEKSLELAKSRGENADGNEIEIGTLYYRLACLDYKEKTLALAKPQFERASSYFESLLLKQPQKPSTSRRLIVLLATSPLTEQRDPERAVALAEHEVQVAPEDGRMWHLLGIARFQAKQYESALFAFEESMRLRNGGNSFDRLFLAMTQYRLGNKQLATKWRDEANEYIANGWQMSLDFTVLDLERFLAEADRLFSED
ncbi:MAG: protein kinase [Planctomycetales bacterium]|nr:protein kinase [Planctomycetales bacterium]